MTTPIGKALGEGNCVRATVGGKEALAKTAQRQFMFLSGETCIGDSRVAVAPGSMACQKAWNRPAEAGLGDAGVSRGRSTAPRHPVEAGRTER